ncbi:MAG: autotransporter domain-containing protein [Sutterella sp.]|nr:autotransporter domain-containing protein [Sutterella sp.]
MFAFAGLPMANAQTAATPYRGSYSETISTAVSKTGDGAVRIGDPNYPEQGAKHILITSTGELTIPNLNFQVTAYVGNGQSPGDANTVAVSGSNVDIDGGELIMTGPTKWLEVGRTNFGFMNVYNGATVTTPGFVGIGAWRSTTSELAYLTIDGEGTTFTAGQEFVVGDTGENQNGAGVLTVSGEAQLTVGKIKTGSSESLAKIYFDNAKLKVTQASTLFENINTVSGSELDVLNIQGELELDTSATGAYTQATNAAISGTGSIKKKGAGNLILVADNTYSGGTHITAGSVQLGNGGTTGSAGTGDITVDSGTTLALYRSDDLTLANLIKGEGALHKKGAGNLILVADNTYSGGTHITEGSVQLGNGGTTGSAGTGDITVDSGTTLALNRSDNLTLANLINGEEGTLRKLGDNTVDFAKKVTVSKTQIDDGTLEVTGDFQGGDVVVGDAVEDPATAKFAIKAGETVSVKSLLIQSDGQLSTLGVPSLPSTLTVENGLVVDGGQWNLTAGSSVSASTTEIKDGVVELPANVTLTSPTVKVGDGEGDAESAKFINEGTLTGLSELAIKSDGSFKTSTDTSISSSITLDGGKAELSGGTTTVPTVTLNAGDFTVGTGATLNANTSITVGNGSDATAALTQQGTVTTNNLTVNSDGVYTNAGALTVNETLQINGGVVNLTAGTTQVTGETNISDGTLNVAEGSTLDTPTLKVGDGVGDPATAIVNNAGTVTATDVTVQSDGKFTNSGKLVSDTVNVKKDGQFTNTMDLTLSNALVVDGGNVALTGGKTETPHTTINEGVLTVGADAQLDGGVITVGDGDTEDAWLKADGSVKGSTIDVASDGHFDIGAGGTATSTGTTTLNGGEITVAQGGTLNVGDPATVGTENLVVNRGTVNANGDVNARNIVSDPALDGAEDDAKVIVGTTGHITLTPTNGDTLLEKFDTTKGDQFQLDGRLTVNTQPNVTTTQADQADITGSGTLEKTGEGALTLTADNTFKTVEADDGTLTVAPESTLTTQTLTVGNADDVDSIVNLQGTTQAQDLTIETDGTLNVGNTTSGDPVNVAVTNPISMDGGNLNVLAGASLNTPNIVTPDLADEKASSVHVEQGGELHLSPTDGSKLFDGFNTNGGKDSIVIDGLLDLTVPAGSTVNQDPQSPIDGSGTFEKNGDGLFNVAANNPFAGNVELNGGETHIMEGGKLGNADVNVHAPATLSVDKEGTSLKSLTLDPGSTLKVVATPEGYSKLDVAEAVNLGGTLFTNIAGSREEDLKNGSFENVIHSENGTISGQFEKFDDNSELFNFVPYITTDKKSVGLTPLAATGDHNLVSIAERMGASRALDAARTLDAVFNQSPDQALSRMFYSISDPEMALQALLQSLPTVSGASSQMVADSSQRLAALTDLRPDCSQTAMGRHVGAKTYGAWARQNGYLGASGYRDDAFGVAAGADVCFNTSRVGFMVGYGNDFVRSRDFPAQQTVRADTLQAGVYGSTPVNDTFDVDFKAGVGYSFVNTKRDIPFAQREAKADFHNTLAYAGVGLNALVLKTDALEVRPFVRLDYFVTHNRSYHETGADELNLHAKSGNYQTLVTQTGVKLHLKVANQVEANALVAVGYNLLSDKASTTAAFEGNPGQTFTTEGAQHGHVSGQFGLDLGYQISPAARFAVGYDLWVRPGYVQHTPNVSFKYTF